MVHHLLEVEFAKLGIGVSHNTELLCQLVGSVAIFGGGFCKVKNGGGHISDLFPQSLIVCLEIEGAASHVRSG